mgnify:CR=1 FL=1
MDFRKEIAGLIERGIRDAFAAEPLTQEQIAQALEIPPDPAMGDFAFPCFRLSKGLRKAPPVIADVLSGCVSAPFLSRVESVKGYLNFFIDRATYAREVVEKALREGDEYGSDHSGAGKTVVMDYSSINIAKRFHIGHLSTTMIGHSLKRIYAFLGWNTVGINHLGDWGTQFGKMICAYKKWGTPEEVASGGIDELTRLYVRFHEEAEKDPSLEDEGRAWFKKIESGDPEAMEIFTRFKEMTLKDAARVYDLLGVSFDSYAGESFYVDKTAAVVDDLRAQGLLVQSEGAWVVDLSEDHMPPCLILKKDGATIYATRDLAAARYRQDTYHFDKCLYVVAYQQDLHFRQVFRVLEKMGYPWAKNCVHVAFGMISFDGEALSTRKGNVVHLDDLLNLAIEKAREIIQEKSPNLEDPDTVARQVGIGAVIYTDLSNNRIKDIDFRWDRALNFDGESGPYVQYTHARCCSLLRKAEPLNLPAPDWSALTDDEAQALLRLMSRFPDTVREAAAKYEPSMITRFVTDVAQAYNKYYYEHRILEGDPAAMSARVALTGAVKNLLKTGLWLIGIESPERM